MPIAYLDIKANFPAVLQLFSIVLTTMFLVSFFLIWVKPMQDINCNSLPVLALLFNSGMYECSKRNTTDKQNSSIFFCTLFLRQRVSGKFIFANAFQGILWGPLKKSIALFLPQYHFSSKCWGLLTRRVIIILLIIILQKEHCPLLYK